MQVELNREFICYFPLAGRCSAISRKAGLIIQNWYLGRQMPSL